MNQYFTCEKCHIIKDQEIFVNHLGEKVPIANHIFRYINCEVIKPFLNYSIGDKLWLVEMNMSNVIRIWDDNEYEKERFKFGFGPTTIGRYKVSIDGKEFNCFLHVCNGWFYLIEKGGYPVVDDGRIKIKGCKFTKGWRKYEEDFEIKEFNFNPEGQFTIRFYNEPEDINGTFEFKIDQF